MMLHSLSELLILILSCSVLALHVRTRTDHKITSQWLSVRSLPSSSPLRSPSKSEISPRSPEENHSPTTYDPNDAPSHHFFVISHATIDPISPTAEILVYLYSTALEEIQARASDKAQSKSGSLKGTQALAFKYGVFNLTFRYDGPSEKNGNEDKGVDWEVLGEFCEDMIEKSKKGMPLTFEGGLQELGDEQNVVFVSMILNERVM